MLEILAEFTEPLGDKSPSIADLFLAANQELARSDARIYRSIDRHLTRTREILKREEFELEVSRLMDKPGKENMGSSSFERQTRKSLETLCKAHGVRGYSRITKEAMIQRLRDEGVEPPPIPIEALTKSELISLLQKVMPRE